MLLTLAQWLQTLSPDLGFFRVFQYITFRAVMAAMTALLIGLVASKDKALGVLQKFDEAVARQRHEIEHELQLLDSARQNAAGRYHESSPHSDM